MQRTPWLVADTWKPTTGRLRWRAVWANTTRQTGTAEQILKCMGNSASEEVSPSASEGSDLRNEKTKATGRSKTTFYQAGALSTLLQLQSPFIKKRAENGLLYCKFNFPPLVKRRGHHINNPKFS